MLGFQMRYYKGHTFLCQSFSFQSLISFGISGVQVSQSTTVLCFISLPSGRETYWSFSKKTINEWQKKKTGTWQHAPCWSFNLVWWIYCYFISTRKKISLLLGQVEFCVVMTVNIHIWKAKWKKIKRNLWNKMKTQDVCSACFMLALWWSLCASFL